MDDERERLRVENIFGAMSLALVDKMQQAYLKVMADKAFTGKMTAQAIQMLPPEQYTASALGKHTQAEITRWKAVAAKANISLD